MKKDLQQAGKVLEEMGFNKNSSQSTKAAFIKHLIKQAYNVDVNIPEAYRQSAFENNDKIKSLFSTEVSRKEATEQLEFNFEETPKVSNS